MKDHRHCQRCGLPGLVLQGSYFNTEMVCPECHSEERQHPDYQKAKDEELAAVKAGDYTFPGIGLPVELRQQALKRAATRKEEQGEM